MAVNIYRITNRGSFATDYGLRDQIRRAAVSISSNIAEGDELDTDKQAIKYFFYAKGSVAELLTQIIISLEIGYIDDKAYEEIEKECKAISSMLTRLIHARGPIRRKTQGVRLFPLSPMPYTLRLIP